MRPLLLLTTIFSLGLALPVYAQDVTRTKDNVPEMTLTLKDHAFDPKQLTVPANQKIKLTVTNADPTPAEFESRDLNREKVVPANKSITLFLDPMEPGSYDFYDDFRKKTTTGTIVAQ